MPQPSKQLSFSDSDSDRDLPVPNGSSRKKSAPKRPGLYHHASKSFKSFHNLVALANSHDEYSEGKKSVWRDVGQPPVPLNTLRLCLEHASRGALSEFGLKVIFLPFLTRFVGAGILAGAFRGGINLFLLIFRVIRAPR